MLALLETSRRRWVVEAPQSRHRHRALPALVRPFLTSFEPHTPQHGQLRGRDPIHAFKACMGLLQAGNTTKKRNLIHTILPIALRSRGGTSQHVVLGGPGPGHKLRSTIWWAVVCSSELSGSRGIWFGSAVPSRPLRERASLVNGDSLGCRQESTYQSCRFVRRPCCRRR